MWFIDFSLEHAAFSQGETRSEWKYSLLGKNFQISPIVKAVT